MYKQGLLVAGLLAVAALALGPGTAAAQLRLGRGAGWYDGGWGGRAWAGDWGRGWGWDGRGVTIGIGSPWYGGYGYRGYGPGYYGYSPYYYGDRWARYDTFPYYGGGWSSYGTYYGDTSGYYGSPPYSDMSSPSYGYGASAQSQDNAAHIRVIVPPDAKLWFGNSSTQQTGAVRFFESPELTPGKDYTYDVKAQWTENGKEVTRTRHLDVRANAGFTVDFTRQ
jgi:uncharacterized protein (TIGR03000 family)